MSEELKSCPFCGHFAEGMETESGNYIIECQRWRYENLIDHIASVEETTKEAAIQRWNTRAEVKG